MPELRIELVVDLVCPWCLVGEARLRQALARRDDVRAELVVRPFLLDPSLPREGRDLREWLTRRYGNAPDSMFARVESVARDVGIPLDFAKVKRIPNTISAHVLIQAAREHGTQIDLTRALFEGYFLEGLDLARTDVLTTIAGRHGLGADEVAMLVDDEAARESVRDEARALSAQGISGVPFFVFGGTHAIAGAQPPASFDRAIDAALSVAA